MTQQEIIEGNKLIAEFMEYEHDEIEEDELISLITYSCYNHLVNLSNVEAWESSVDDWTSWLKPDEMLFHSSWDWLMPCIKECLYKSEEDLDEWEYYYEQINDSLFQVEIMQTWNFVIQFIKWYNQNKKIMK